MQRKVFLLACVEGRINITESIFDCDLRSISPKNEFVVVVGSSITQILINNCAYFGFGLKIQFIDEIVM